MIARVPVMKYWVFRAPRLRKPRNVRVGCHGLDGGNVRSSGIQDRLSLQTGTVCFGDYCQFVATAQPSDKQNKVRKVLKWVIASSQML